MALTLNVDTPRWRAMVDSVWGSFDGLIPVVKGNGYGFGRAWLAQEAIQRGATEVAVGTIYELAHVLALPVRPMVLTPSLDLDTARISDHVVLTVASQQQVEHLVRFRPRGTVVVKIATTMQRHGLAPHHIPAALRRLTAAGVDIHSVAAHPALTGSGETRRQEIESMLPMIPPHVPVSVSHLDADSYAELRSRRPERRFYIRVGSALWHGDKAALALRARVLDFTPVLAGARAGYRSTLVPGDGTIVIVDAGSSHGVTPLPDGSSPFHYAKRRLSLVEPPHMHVSMAFVANGDPCPAPGDEVDVQRPLLATEVDRIVWH